MAYWAAMRRYKREQEQGAELFQKQPRKQRPRALFNWHILKASWPLFAICAAVYALMLFIYLTGGKR